MAMAIKAQGGTVKRKHTQRHRTKFHTVSKRLREKEQSKESLPLENISKKTIASPKQKKSRFRTLLFYTSPHANKVYITQI